MFSCSKLEKVIRWTVRIAGLVMVLLSFVNITCEESDEDDIII